MSTQTLDTINLKTYYGDTVEIHLAKYWVERESDNVEIVMVQRGGKRPTQLGRIDTKERTYNARHQRLNDFVRRWDVEAQMPTVTLGFEELILAKQHGVLTFVFFDEETETHYRTTRYEIRDTGWAAEREIIGWRWVCPFSIWEKS